MVSDCRRSDANQDLRIRKERIVDAHELKHSMAVDEHKDVVVASREHLRLNLHVHQHERPKALAVLQTM